VTISSWLNFGRPAPREGGLRRGENFGLRVTYGQRAVFASLRALFSLSLYTKQHVSATCYAVTSWLRTRSAVVLTERWRWSHRKLTNAILHSRLATVDDYNECRAQLFSLAFNVWVSVNKYEYSLVTFGMCLCLLFITPAPLIGGGIKLCFCLTSDACLSVWRLSDVCLSVA